MWWAEVVEVNVRVKGMSGKEEEAEEREDNQEDNQEDKEEE